MTRLVVDVRVDVAGFGVDAQFDAPTGITVLSGPSGSGKSLTLAAIAGTLRPSRGHIIYDDQVFADVASGVHMRSQQRRLGMVYQHAALFEHRSPLDNVRLAVHGIEDRAEGRAEDIARRLLERVGVAHLVDANTRGLSGGERQRVALARALAGGPQMLLLDEPFSSLDAATRTSMRALVREMVTERQITALLVTHDAQDVDALADQVVHYEPGRTVGSQNGQK
jgi:ABC-type sulfate/molybdate transport systems ATPase subunit